MRLSVLCTIIALLTLLTVSGPHLVHHVTDFAASEEHHTHADAASHDHQAPHEGQSPTRPPCPVFMVLQQTPATMGGVTLPALLLTVVAPLPVPSPLWASATPPTLVQTRAPPAYLR